MFESLKQAIQTPALSGVFVLAVTGLAAYLLKSIPNYLWVWLRWHFSVHVHIRGEDEVFDWVNEWLADHPYTLKARTLKLSSGRRGTDTWSLAPGYGLHVFWDDGLIFLNRQIDDKANATGYQIRPKETIKITVIGRRQNRVRQMIEAAQCSKHDVEATSVSVWASSWWTKLHSQPRRSMDTIYLPPELKSEIVGQTRWFFENSDWFESRGIPYRQAFMFEGPPGTGKTSLATALAAEFKKSIYILNLSTVSSDTELLQAFKTAGKNCFLLIEDVDTADASKTRQTAAPAKKSKSAAAPAEAGVGTVTLSGLLNALDGVAAPYGQIVIFTTNHPEKIDPALVRDERATRFFIGPIGPAEVAQMANKFFPDDPDMRSRAVLEAGNSAPRVAAAWQKQFKKWWRDSLQTSTRRAA